MSDSEPDTDIEPDSLEGKIRDMEDDQSQVLSAIRRSPAQSIQMGPPPNATPTQVLGIINNFALAREQLQNNIANMWNAIPLEYTDVMEDVMGYLQGNNVIQTILPTIQDDDFWSWYKTVPIEYLTNLAVMVSDDDRLDNAVTSLWDALETGEGITADTEDPEGEEHEDGAGRRGSGPLLSRMRGRPNLTEELVRQIIAESDRQRQMDRRMNPNRTTNPSRRSTETMTSNPSTDSNPSDRGVHGGYLVRPFHLKPGSFY